MPGFCVLRLECVNTAWLGGRLSYDVYRWGAEHCFPFRGKSNGMFDRSTDPISYEMPEIMWRLVFVLGLCRKMIPQTQKVWKLSCLICALRLLWRTAHWVRNLIWHKRTPWSRVRNEKLPVSQLLKNLQIFYGTRRFITVFKEPSTGPNPEPDEFVVTIVFVVVVIVLQYSVCPLLFV
jgi:hypothetical protein